MSLESRFWAKVERCGPDECWPWTNATNEHGYGVMRPEGQRTGSTVKAHRVSAQLAGMDINGRKVRHSCDNPPCCNPAHLTPGTQADNVRDMHERGRGNVGSVNGMARWTEAQVVEVRTRVANGERRCDVADSMGIPRQTVSRIVNRKGWTHVA